MTGLSDAAWRAADAAFDNPIEGNEDELHQALVAASPYIRVEELDDLIECLTVKSGTVRGRAGFGFRLAIQELVARREELIRSL